MTDTKAFPKPSFITSGPHLSGFRVCLGYNTLAEAQDAHEALAAQPSAGAQGEAANKHRAFVNRVGRLPHPADDDYAYPEDGDAEREALNGLIADAREIMSATPAQPDTGDVAALRESIARIIDPKGWEFYDRHKPNPIMGAEIANETRPSLATADEILAALSKPNALGAR